MTTLYKELLEKAQVPRHHAILPMMNLHSLRNTISSQYLQYQRYYVSVCPNYPVKGIALQKLLL